MNFKYDRKKIAKLLPENLNIPGKKLAIANARKDRVSYVHNTAALEGNPMTYAEAQTLLEGITVGGHKLSDEKQILNQNESWSKLLELLENDKFALNKEIFCELHAIVAEEEAVEWGKFRKSEVKIGGTEYRPPKSDRLDAVFNDGIKEIKKETSPVIQAFLMFLFCAVNQFFFDGNKRTGRLMMNGILLDNGYYILNINAKDRLEFNRHMIGFYDSQDATNVMQYLVNYYISQSDSY